MSRSVFSIALLAVTVGCTRNAADALSYRPSMTQLRTGEVVVPEDEKPFIPEGEFLPGIVVAPDDVVYDDESGGRRASSAFGAASDFSFMKELENPALLEKHVGTYDYTLVDASLFDEHDDQHVEYTDVHQGSIGDCYFAAALSAVTYSDNDYAVRDGMVRETYDDKGNIASFVVRFYDAWGEPQDIEVDAQLVRRNGKPLYMRSGDSVSSLEEIWPGIVEKAYAKWHGDYEKIGNGGFPGDVMQALTGAQANWKQIKWQSEASLHRAIEEAVDANRPVVAWTFGEDSGVDYDGSGVYAWHAYSVHGSRVTEDGEYQVQLRNPWGSSEPAGNGPDDGIFWFPYRDFYRLYSSIAFGGSYERDITAPAEVTDLKLVGVGAALAVGFTTTGDDATSGLAASYDLRVLRNGSLDDTNFFDGEKIDTPDPQSPGTEVTLELGELEPGDYTVGVKMVDESGNSSPLSNVVQFTIEGDDPTPPAATDPYWVFADGPGTWSSTGDWTYTGTSFLLGDPSTGNYDFGRTAFGRLESPPVDLATFSSPYIIWDHILDVESGNEYDRAHLEVSADGFASSTTIWEKATTGDTYALDYVYLDDFQGQTVQFAFVFDSVDEAENSTRGWEVVTVLVDGD